MNDIENLPVIITEVCEENEENEEEEDDYEELAILNLSKRLSWKNIKSEICTFEFLKNITNWFTFVMLGFVNNVSYVIVISSGQYISHYYGQERFYGVIIWANIGAGLVFQLCNTFFLKIFSHTCRLFCVAIMFLIGLISIPLMTVIFGKKSALGFWMTVVSILFVGAGCALGANLIVGYMKVFSSNSKTNSFVISGWGSGTGLAGLGGTGIYLLLNTIGFGIFWKYGMVVPMVFIYVFMFVFCIFEPGRNSPCPKCITNNICVKAIRRRKKIEEDVDDILMLPEGVGNGEESLGLGGNVPKNNCEVEMEEKESRSISNKNETEEENINSIPLLSHEEGKGEEEEENITVPIITSTTDEENSLTLNTIHNNLIPDEDTESPSSEDEKRSVFVELRKDSFDVIRGMYWVGGNLFLIYWFEYVICTCCAEKIFNIKESSESPNWAVRNAYEIFSCCYQLGVLVSRSSLICIKIKKMALFTVLQFVFLVTWILLAKFRWLSDELSVWPLFAFMICVGLLGGASYVNGYYLLINSSGFRNEKNRETAVNLSVICDNLGIVFSSLTTILFDNTLLKE